MNSDPRQMALRLRRLKLRHFEVLLAVAEHGSLTAAAAALGSSQPAVSQQLAETEDALGFALFFRGRQIKPTPYLPAVLRYVRRVINNSHHLQNELETLALGGRSIVRVGTMLVTGTELLPNAIIGLRQQSELIQLEVVEDIASGLWSRFERQEIDLIVGRLDERAFTGAVLVEALYQDPHCVVVGRQHPLLKKKRVVWRDTLSYPWVLPPRHTELRRAIDATFLDQSLDLPVPWIESASSTVNLVLLGKTDCLNVVSRSAARLYAKLNAFSVLPLELKYDVGPIGMAWADEEESPALAAVLAAVRRSVDLG
ncbi:LysR family transcriptional regulator [Paralcaligenes ureilyticus]|uniref:LysR family transcriptional regulator n=1 Tax=Paralcaligenes ureilyticus TaxID=627131 RepID=A0A4R3LZJ9_9BURK|nr:LysR family transcriptional regulator [Paralcaligenes ureilyticus]TCT05736.1 LysR family transcriptional regulator [Paralcaligenes ureilyticus]